MIRRTFVLVSLLIVTGVSLAAQDVTGRWTAKFMTQVGEQEYTFEFVQKGTQLTGTATGNLLGKSEIAEGKVEGGTITFVENGSYMEMPLRIVYTGKIVSANEIRFTRNVADIANEELVATRAK